MTTARGEHSRQRIVAAAAEVAAEYGYEGTTISRVTKRCGLPASSVYWYFEDKDALLAEVVTHSFESWYSEQPHWDLLPDGDLLAGLGTVLRTAFRSLQDSPDFLRIGHMLTLESREVESAARTRFLTIREHIRVAITGWFAQAMEATGITAPPALAEELARVIIVCSDGLFLSYRAGIEIDSDQYVDMVLAVVDQTIEDAVRRR